MAAKLEAMMTAKPYKKRFLFSFNQVASPMEIETSDGTERNQTTSPSSQEESEKDKEPSKMRKAWKKKVCRKQFRHHDIEIFKPGTNPSKCLLKHKETSPTSLKKVESQNDPIRQSILHPLVVDKSSLYFQKSVPTSTNNVSDTTVGDTNQSSHQLKMAGRHNLPAIVSEAPNIRRRSIEVGCGIKLSWTAPALLPSARRLSIDMPLLNENKPMENSVEVLCANDNGTIEQEKYSNNMPNTVECMDWKEDKSSEQSGVKDVSNTYKMDVEVTNGYRNLDFRVPKRRMSEVPVDLSIKNTDTNNLKTQDKRNTDNMSSLKATCDYEKLIESQWFNTRTYGSDILQESIQHSNSLRKLEEEINFHIAKINNVFQKTFSTNNFRRICQSYQHLNTILTNCATMPLEIRAYIEKILNETFKYISEKLIYVNLDPLEIIQILGEQETTKEKVAIMKFLNQIFYQGGNIQSQTMSYSLQTDHKEAIAPRIPPKEKIHKIRSCQKKTDELKQDLPPYNTFLPNYMNSLTVPNHPNSLSNSYPIKLQVDQQHSLSQWRYNSDILTPSPTSSNVTFQSHLTSPPTQCPNRPNSLPNMNNLALSESAAVLNNLALSESATPLNNVLCNRPELHISTVHSAVVEEPRERSFLENRRFLDEQNKIKTIRLEKPEKKKGIGVQKVIVGDTSMQITKEIVKTSKLNESKCSKDQSFVTREPEKKVIESHSLIKKNKTEIEFLNIIQKLKNEYPEEKMTALLLSQLQNTNKKRKAVVESSEPIEITDSDSEDSRKGDSTPRLHEKEENPTNRSNEIRKMKLNFNNRRPEHLEIPTKTKLGIQTKIRLDKHPTPTAVHCTVQKTVYSPEIEPISPVEENTVFRFPDLHKTQKTLTLHKNKEKKIDFPKMKRKKSEDSNDSVRAPPHGKLCYIREQNIFLRYFDESQAKLFIENSILRGDESTNNKSSLNKDISPSEKIHIPPQVEFSHKEDIPEPIEFVRELKLVEQFVPKDFAAFYRFVTGYQIVRNKNPVSLQTFLLMYNTNGITELLNKYLTTTEGDQLVPM